MLRVLKPGGTIAFSTWPPHLYVGKMFDLVARFAPPPPGVPKPSAWGDTNFIRDALGEKVEDLCFDAGLMNFAAMSIGHCIHSVEKTVGPVVKFVQGADAASLKAFREEFRKLAEPYFENNLMRQHYLMTRAVKTA
jgi:hypothetical protein